MSDKDSVQSLGAGSGGAEMTHMGSPQSCSQGCIGRAADFTGAVYEGRDPGPQELSDAGVASWSPAAG